MSQDIMLTVDYHDANCVVRRRDLATGKESLRKVATERSTLRDVMAGAVRESRARGGRAVWIQESTTGWARMQRLASECGAEFVLANVLQMPLPPKAKRRKTDKVDTARLQREYLNGELPRAHQPAVEWRQLRRLVALRENLVRRRTALSNWLNRYVAHETWAAWKGVKSADGIAHLRALPLPESDRQIVNWKLEELKELARRLVEVETVMLRHYRASADAQRLDRIRGLGRVASIAIVARIGPITRFQDADQLIGFAGLAPGIRQSDATSRGGKIGGGGTDKCLRHYLIEATVWAKSIPRYEEAYERTLRRRGKKIARLTVARLLLRSIHKMLSEGVEFEREVHRPSGR
jgi:transposase